MMGGIYLTCILYLCCWSRAFTIHWLLVHLQWGQLKMFFIRSSGGAGALDAERRSHPGEQRPGLPAAEDSLGTDSLLPHPADLPLHLREQKDGHHRQGVETCIKPS